MSENNDYKRLRENMPQFGDRIDRIENIVVDGMPDINFCSDGFECWIEQKSPTEPKRAGTKLFGSNHKVSQDQANWFLRQRNAGGQCYFLITTDKRWILINGSLADDINNMTVEELVDNSIWSTSRPIRCKEQWMSLRIALRKRR